VHRYDIGLDTNADDALTLIGREIPEKSRVLELGCGNGRLTRHLAEEKGCRVSIVDQDSFLFQKAAAYASDGICDDLEKDEWRIYYEKCRFDRIVLADVLEHLADPADILNTCVPLLNPGGRLLISVPNFGHNDILLQLFHDELMPTETGIMDYTHITIFTYHGIRAFLKKCGLKEEKIMYVTRPTGGTEQMAGKQSGPGSLLASFKEREFGEVYQWVISTMPAADRTAEEFLSRREQKLLEEKEQMGAEIRELQKERRRLQRISKQRDDNIQHLQRVIRSMEHTQDILQKDVVLRQREIEIYRNSTSWRITKPCRAAGTALRRMMGMRTNGNDGAAGTAEKALPEPRHAEEKRLLRDYDRPVSPYRPLVSVVVPCYQHAEYLEERLKSILSQTYDRTEVILLDDGSTDGSREILEAFREQFPDTRILFNEHNTGDIFAQWMKGIRMARGSLIWIAESDDSCRPDFLEMLVPLMAHESVMLAFTGCDFVKDGKTIWTTEEYLAELPGLSWDSDFILSSAELVNAGFGALNLIPNVSACLFRNPPGITEETASCMSGMRLCGDWLFYLSVLRGGYAAYSAATRNYYRVHPDSRSLEVQKTDRYYVEYGRTMRTAALYYPFREKTFRLAVKKLTEHYLEFHGTSRRTAEKETEKLIGESEIIKARGCKKPHILMCGFSLRAGGGETFAIHLANQLKKMDITVTFMDFGGEKRDDRIRSLLRPDIPLITLSSTDDLMRAMKECGADIVHTHHASVDGAVADWLKDVEGKAPVHVVTLHGMYETIRREDRTRTIRLLSRTCRKFVYIADKNLEPFRRCRCYRERLFTKIGNALPRIPAVPVERKELGFSEEDFVCVLASRGIPEKGWAEAVEAVHIANLESIRPIRLAVLGEGEMKGRLENPRDPYVVFMGVKENVRDYFAMGDLGILPTYFKGESSPLTVIECLQAGRPVLATDIGEVKNQLAGEDGLPAGELLHLKHGRVSAREIAGKLKKLAEDREHYRILKDRCRSAAEKFDMEAAAAKYLEVYREVLK